MRLRDEVAIAATEYGMVLLDERAGRYWQLSPVGAVVVEQMGLGNGIDATVDSVTGRFDVGFEQAHADIEAFLRKLAAVGLVTV